MKVLIIITDLYRNIGGGQSVYRRIIESAPDIDFFYYREEEPADAARPRNAHAIPLSGRLRLKVLSAPPFPAYLRAPLQLADRFARAVAGQHFDIVDVPDFYPLGGLLRDALAHHQVSADRIVLAMHGNISVSLEMGWGSAGDNVLEQRLLEYQQFEEADGVYAISPRYIREWQAQINRPVQYIDPLTFVDIPASVGAPHFSPRVKPNLYCIGRTERRKGNDLFVEIVRWLDPTTYARAAHIGDEVLAPWGVGTRAILFDIAKKRDTHIDYFPSFDRARLKALFREPSVVILPVRYDTLNLIALEALFEGCPVAISSEAGVCDYLHSSHAQLPYVKINFANFYGAVSAINELLSRYHEAREGLRNYLLQALPRAARDPDIGSMYRRILADLPTAVRLRAPATRYLESGRTPFARAGRLARRFVPLRTYRTARRIIRAPREYLLRKLRESEYLGDARFLAVLADARKVPERLKRIAAHSEYNRGRLREKLNEIYGACSSPLYRCNFWLDIARIERILGNALVAATYELRALRLVGSDVFGILPRVVSTLEAEGLVLEAEAARTCYADPDAAPQRVYAFLQERYRQNRQAHALPYETIDDHRRGTARVAVIVSLYNAAAKLPVFLTTMLQQTLVKRGEVEFIFVDSGSPDRERQLLQQCWSETPLNAVYARTAQRETIQAAWNRGILLARAPLLVFLGADETLYPEALEVLAYELDSHPAADWAMANSLVTAVDARGIYKHDIMRYDRTGGTKDHTYLETCYLSWVGGMYRRSIHERFGYYDPSFAAAGDTEFKNRVLPYINVRFVDRTLGLFLNYQEERTTASVRAEIEDLRAWYIHRTPGGVRYAFEHRDTADIERLLRAALGYRKSYCTHVSSDIEYAQLLASFLDSGDATAAAGIGADMAALLKLLRAGEFATLPPSVLTSIKRLTTSWRAAARLQKKHRLSFGGLAMPTYKILNDNRYEQHSWLWRTS